MKKFYISELDFQCLVVVKYIFITINDERKDSNYGEI